MIGNAKSWSDYPLASSVPVGATVLAFYNGSVVQVTPANFLAASLPQQGNFYALNPQVGTVPLISYQEYPFTINGLNNLKTASGSIHLTIQINGVSVTGLNNITVNTTPQNITVTALNAVPVGARVTQILATNNASTGLEYTMKGTLST